ncbi:hypothetical protein NMG60_11006318 [Bertholletia excelsa]
MVGKQVLLLPAVNMTVMVFLLFASFSAVGATVSQKKIEIIQSSCNGTLAECLAGEVELEMDSDTSMRLLQQAKIDPFTGFVLNPKKVANANCGRKSYKSCLPPLNGNKRRCIADPYERCKRQTG